MSHEFDAPQEAIRRVIAKNMTRGYYLFPEDFENLDTNNHNRFEVI